MGISFFTSPDRDDIIQAGGVSPCIQYQMQKKIRRFRLILKFFTGNFIIIFFHKFTKSVKWTIIARGTVAKITKERS